MDRRAWYFKLQNLRYWFRRTGRRWVPRVLISLGLLLLVAWAASGGNDLGERSGLLQGVVAFILLWVTWASIDRADRQIEITQSQTDALLSGERDHLLYVFAVGNDEIQATNLSKYPLIIQFAWFPPEYIADAPETPLNLTLMPGTTVTLIKSIREKVDFIPRFDREAALVLVGPHYPEPESPPIVFEVKYIYGGTGSIQYTKVYQLHPLIGNENYSRGGHAWKVDLWLRDFMYEIKGHQDTMTYHIPVRDESKIPLPDDEAARSFAEFTNEDIRFWNRRRGEDA